VATSGRFEWIAIPRHTNIDLAANNTKTAAAAARACIDCGWLDSVERFEALSGEAGVRECRRCGRRWDLTHEINLFLKSENLKLPGVRLGRNYGDIRQACRSNLDDPQLFEHLLRARQSALQKGFERLICLDTTLNIEHLEHQIKAAFMVLRKMRSRALLADEVGLGKTIEAGILVKELLIRGLAKHVLVMVPAGLCCQWQSEFRHSIYHSHTVRSYHSHSVPQGNITQFFFPR